MLKTTRRCPGATLLLVTLATIFIIGLSYGQESGEWFSTRPKKEQRIINDLRKYGIKYNSYLIRLAAQGIGVDEVKKLKKSNIDLLELSNGNREIDYTPEPVLSEVEGAGEGIGARVKSRKS